MAADDTTLKFGVLLKFMSIGSELKSLDLPWKTGSLA
jgi:hypothetical protein